MIQITNEEAWAGVIAAALITIEGNHSLGSFEKIRWVNAVAKAVIRIEKSGAFMTWQPEAGTLLIWSDSNEIYEANGVCQCLAHMNGQPCWHMAAKRLIERYEIAVDRIELDAVEARNAERLAIDSAPYLKPESVRKSETVGSVRI